ncbi:MAG: SDR family NAD(P)-dependent oxidoreductase [Chloroflexota bacterium]
MAGVQGKVILISGAGRGLGRAMALGFAGQGARVAANDITPVNLDHTLAQLQASGGQARDYVFDVGKLMPVNSLVEAVLDDWGRIDVLINCAGVMPHAALLEMDEWDWWRTLDVNLSGAFYLIQRVGRVMRDAGGGVMINVTAAPEPPGGRAGRAAFRVSKAGLAALSAEAAVELAPCGIQVHTLALELDPAGEFGEQQAQRAVAQALAWSSGGGPA